MTVECDIHTQPQDHRFSTCVRSFVEVDRFKATFRNPKGQGTVNTAPSPHIGETRDSNLVDSASSIRLSQRLSHARLSISIIL